jgi:hypothetical protein
MSNESRTHCANCDHRLSPWDKFCSQCGQDTLNHPPSLWEFIHEWALHYVAFEGKLWKSLWALIAKPGFLTQEYLAGRKQRYVLPLRLVLTFGLLFFLSVKFSPSVVEDAIQAKATQASSAQAASDAEEGPALSSPPPEAASAVGSAVAKAPWAPPPQASGPPMPVVLDPETREKLPGWLRTRLEQLDQRVAQNREAAWGQFKSTLLSLAPYAVLLSLPLFAGLLKLLFPGTVYGSHFVFAMHLHAAWYLMLVLGVLFQGQGWITFALWLWSNLYPLMALKRVNGTGWPSALLRGAALAALHWVVISLVVVGLAVVGLASV